MTLSISQVFEGRRWVMLPWVTAVGVIGPAPSAPVTDVLQVKHAYTTVGPGVYLVLNLSKGYTCFVQFRRGEQGQKYGRCDHENCIWQSRTARPKPCKHMRAACPFHVKFVRRAKIQTEPMAKYEKGGACPNCGEGRLMVEEHRAEWEPRPGQRFYYEQWFRCHKCLDIFHDERHKRPVEEWRQLSA